ncbi:Mitochondrial-processing peptidase subunit alpha [Grifola frondosa]|uniref:Mitochondrial-processing peptidase subunit alpha n=1 Tax=Grifola frondosa TaxID=5627 RepID=A0A1C7MW42_GRIFR|nr:Mitochondrial-processing peptidase subunit alpha [Grifola frondosa]
MAFKVRVNFVDVLKVNLTPPQTTSQRSADQMSSAIDALGGQILCSSSRESIMYQSSHFHQATPLAMSLIADTTLNPSFLPEEIDAQREAARYELREVTSKPEMILPEVLHSVAYDGKTLGNPMLCPEERIDLVDERTMRQFMQELYRPERMVIAGAGMPHEELVELTDKYFSSLKFTPPPQVTSPRPNALPPQPPSQLLPSSSPSLYKSLTRAASSYLYPLASTVDPTPALAPVLNSRATYTGGHKFIHDTTTEFNHIYLAYEGVGIHDDDVYALATIQVLLGGGGSFSAGQLPAHIFPHLVHQLSLLLYTPIPKVELSRAKNQLMSSLMMALESRAVEVEDLGRQVLVHDRKVPVSEMCDKINEVTPESLRRVATRIFGPDSSSKPTVVCMGREDIGDWRATVRKYGLGGV